MDANFKTKIFNKLTSKMKLKQITKLRCAVIFAMLIKTIFFIALLEEKEAKTLTWNNISFKFSIVYLAFIVIIFSFSYLLSLKKQLSFYIVFDVLYTILLIFDLWYFRANKDFLGLKNIFFTNTFNPMGQSLFRPELIDVIFIIDLALLINWSRKIHQANKEEKSKFKFILALAISILTIGISYFFINVEGMARWDERLFTYGWSALMSVRTPGPIGYHGFEAYETIEKLIYESMHKETPQVKEWLADNKEEITDNEFKGMLSGKNIIFLQLESFENFIINRKVNGKEITPFLNKLAKEGLYFDNIYEQNNGGNSIDCDLMVSASVLPLGETITAINHGEAVYPFALPRLLKSKGYLTITTHGEEPGEFNWTELHKNGFGVDKLWDISQYNYDEGVGYGISDRSFLSQLADKLKDVKQPFYILAPTLSSHGPYDIAQKYRELNLPEEIDKSYLGGYFESVHYTDKQIQMFFEKLDSEGLLDNTVVVIYGDHSGVHKYYNKDIQKLSYDGDWWKEYDHKIPLFIYSKGIRPKVFHAYGGQIDIMPTTAYLVGIEDYRYRDYVMGRILVNTNRNATVLKNNTIEGLAADEKEKLHLLSGYDIGSKLIKNGYK